MVLKCQAPSCDYEFDDAVIYSPVDARDAGETPLFAHVYETDDGLGVATDRFCSADCMAEYLEEVLD